MSEEVLLEKIQNLSDKVVDGFKGVHDRQDKTNGRIDKSEKRINVIEKWMYGLVGGGVALGLIPAAQEFLSKLVK